MITLIGTGHVFDLNNQIRNIILKKHPDLIALELDKGRYAALIQKDVDEKREGLYGKMAATQEKIAGMYGVSVGSEMLTSVNVAKELGIRIAFIDMPAESIQKRLQDALTKKEKLRISMGILQGIFIRKKKIEKEIKKFEKNEIEYMNYMKEKFPSLMNFLLDEREEYMSKKILELKKRFDNILVFVGDAHIDGLKKRLNTDLEIIRLKELRNISFDNSDITLSYNIDI